MQMENIGFRLLGKLKSKDIYSPFGEVIVLYYYTANKVCIRYTITIFFITLAQNKSLVSLGLLFLFLF